MTQAKLARGDPDGLDGLNIDALVLPFFEARRQPKLVAGYADWRLGGRIARLIFERRFVGTEGDALLMPGMGRLGAERIFLLGLGDHKKTSKPNAERWVKILADAGARRFALGLPAEPETGEIIAEPVGWVEAWFAAVARTPTFEIIVMLDADDGLKKREDKLRKVAKRAGLDWSS